MVYSRGDAARLGKRLRIAGLIAPVWMPLACAAFVLTACSDDDKDQVKGSASQAQEYAATLPGAHADDRPGSGLTTQGLAQGFAIDGNTASASHALLPPVMHSAD
jgi:hypothetical protein